MKLTGIILFIAFLHVSAIGLSQKVTLSLKDAPLENVFNQIKQQTGLSFLWDESLLKQTSPVTINVHDATVSEVLDIILKNQGLTYSLLQNMIVIKKSTSEFTKPFENIPPPPGDIHGRVTDSLGNPLSGASVTIKKSKKGTSTDNNGYFKLTDVDQNATLVISFTGFVSREYKVNSMSNFMIALDRSSNPLDQVQVIAYGTTTQRLNTGDVSTVSAKIIEDQPVSNALGALEGRVPGLVITQNTGLPGGGYSVQIRGQNSLVNGNDPFYVIDGVPYSSQIPFTSNGLGLINSNLKGGSPLSYLNPYDIESIEILKDADATAIYGSQAANGAILITTKKGKAGAMRLNLNLTSGFASPSRDIGLLNTQQYLQMRHEAFTNDGETPQSYDYDVNGTWDTTRYTNWSKVLTENSSHYSDAELSLSGGNINTQYLIGGGYNYQSTGYPTLIPGDGEDKKGSVHFNINSSSNDKKFKVTLGGNYISDKNTVQYANFSQTRLGLAPDSPPLYNPDGSLNWAPLVPGQKGTWTNPLAILNSNTQALTSNLIANGILSYMLLPGLELKSSFGYTNTQMNQVQTKPTTIFDPGLHRTSGSSVFNASTTSGWIIEPQLSYLKHLGRGVLSALIGGSFHSQSSEVQYLNATGFISDALLANAQAASSISVISNSSQYKYDAVFGRLNYNWEDKYLLNITGRRDGSSRFGPGKQFGNFGAAGAAWIFTKENIIRDNLHFLSFGKLRASYGTTGNDQIGDYQFLDLYRATPYPYAGTQGLYPNNLYNPDLAWEIDKKLEFGILLGFLKDRITIEASYFRNRSDNQLVSTPVSLVTGYTSVPSNLKALVQNSGVEFVLNTININTRDFIWKSSINLSLNRNKLISFPNFESSGYTYNLMIGQPITIQRVFHLIGVNDTTGLYQFATTKSGPSYNPNSETDRTSIINTTPKYYGGFANTFSYKGFSLEIFFQFVKQTGLNIWGSYQGMPGAANSNMPLEVLNHWQKPGDNKPYQMFSQDYSSNAYNQLGIAEQSDFIYGDASYIRLKNLAVSWQVPQGWSQKAHIESCHFFIKAQNILTITSYNGIDPESQSTGYPPQKVWTAGIGVTL